ncbi:LysR family transcriptional regulator [Devosia sp. Root436]|uniref:LysR family transcriptional regulator n=1 Tax=Devosia sp. Root436 TaxID=1736537 RepID=UPI0006FBB164|nr:LysR family transcriptional regulator [Devosia sp. Root436]KQX42862.1 LysR family transcriptional regulator [Devosia sp. Root436]
MIDWDDVRFFLAVARSGSVRSAAESLKVNHTTVLRRISHLEARLGARLFEKKPAGYQLTGSGQEVLALAEEMELSSSQLEGLVWGRDEGIAGPLRVAMAQTIATHLLMPDFAEFCRRHPEIELTILSSEATVNLTNREADVALRVVIDRDALPLNLHGLQGPELRIGAYLSRSLLEQWSSGALPHVPWVTKGFDEPPEWVSCGDIPIEGTFRAPETATHLAALRQGIGVGTLPRFVGDTEPGLVHAPGTLDGSHGALWILSQGETRRTKRVRLFIDFISQRLAEYAPRLLGSPSEVAGVPEK